jgi:hypothetical protein
VNEDSNRTNETPEAVINIGGEPLQEGGSCLIEEPLDPCAIVIIGACGDGPFQALQEWWVAGPFSYCRSGSK